MTKSRQAEWRDRNIADGNCADCGRPRGKSPSRSLCTRHLLARRKKARTKGKFKAHRKGGEGRPPLV